MTEQDNLMPILALGLIGVGAYFLIKELKKPPVPPEDEIPPEEPPLEVDFDLEKFDIKPSYAREGDRIKLIFRIKNLGKDHEINCGTTFFFSGGGYLDFPWFKFYKMKTNETYEMTMPIDIGSGWPKGDYDVVCKIWERSSGGTKIQDLNSVGALYKAGTGKLYRKLDEKWHDFDIK